MEFGAVYHAELMPDLPAHLCTAGTSAASGTDTGPASTASLQNQGKKGKKRKHGQTEREFQEEQRKMRPTRLLRDTVVEAGAYFR